MIMSTYPINRKVLLINPRKGWRPPLGLLYIASYLRDAGYKVKVIEFIDENYNRKKINICGRNSMITILISLALE